MHYGTYDIPASPLDPTAEMLRDECDEAARMARVSIRNGDAYAAYLYTIDAVRYARDLLYLDLEVRDAD